MLFKESIKRFTPPKGWSWASIGDVAKLSFSSVDKKSVEGENAVRLCNYMDVFYNRRIREGMPFMVSTASESDIKKFTLNKGDVVLTKDSETPEEIAFAAVIDEQIDNLVCGYHLAVLRPDKAKVTGEYLMSAINFHPNHHQFIRLANGATRFGLGIDSLNNALLPIPPLAEQRKIAEILRTWDDAIETAQAELKVKQERKRWLMHKLLTCPSKHNGALHQNTWTTVGLGEVASFQNGEAFSSRYFNSDKRGLRLIRNRDLKNDDQIIFYDGEYSAKDVVNDGDLLVGMDGDFTPVIWSKGKALLNQRVGRITVKPEISQSYIYYTLYSVLTELEHVTSATTVKHLSSKGCLLLKISMPPFTSQCLISGILQSADADIESINQRIDSLRTQKRGLMQKLLTGEVRVVA